MMNVNDVEWENGQGIEDLATCGTQPLAVFSEVCLEMISDLDNDMGDYPTTMG
jgi:hypothetical protein